MDSKGFKFLKTTRPNEMDKWGNLVLGTRAASEPQRASRPSVSTQTNEYSSRPQPSPSAPPFIHSMGQSRSPIRSTAVVAVPMATQVPKPHSPQLRKASVQGKTILSRIPVSRVYNHQNNKILYEDMHGDLFTTPTLPYGHYRGNELKCL